MTIRGLAVVGVLGAVLAVPAARGGVELLGVAEVPGDRSDRSGLRGQLPDGTPRDRLGGLGSAIASTGRKDEYLLASDRGPADGATDFPCRVHRMEIAVRPGQSRAVRVRLTATTLLHDEAGRPFTGALTGLDRADPEKSQRLDPEGVRVGRSGSFFLADEYGPHVWEFDPRGRRVRSLPVPVRFRPERPSADPREELPPRNRSGRQPNRGLEGLAISPDGRRLFAILQSPLIQDGALDGDGKRIGVNCRLLEIEVESGRTREYVYPLETPAAGVSEIVAVSERTFLVLERDSLGGTEARVKRIYRISLDGATDVGGIEALPGSGLPAGVKAVGKEMLVDLLDPRLGLRGAEFPEKVEGLAFGPDLPDGRRLLLVTADNDFIANRPLRIWALAVDRADLPGYQAQAFDRPMSITRTSRTLVPVSPVRSKSPTASKKG